MPKSSFKLPVLMTSFILRCGMLILGFHLWNRAHASCRPPKASVFKRSEFSMNSIIIELPLLRRKWQVQRWEAAAPSCIEKPHKSSFVWRSRFYINKYFFFLNWHFLWIHFSLGYIKMIVIHYTQPALINDTSVTSLRYGVHFGEIIKWLILAHHIPDHSFYITLAASLPTHPPPPGDMVRSAMGHHYRE